MVRNERRERRPVADPPRVRGLGPADVGRALRNERIRQGLSHRDVSRRLGISEELLRAAETGTLGRTDQLSTLKTVRRFADLLGLPGDRYALAILEQWPTAAGAAFASRPGTVWRDEPTAATPVVGGGAGAVETGAWAASESGLFGSPFTPFDVELPYDADFAQLDGRFEDRTAMQPVDTGDATGIVPAVPIATTGAVVHRTAMPAGLRVTAAVLAAAVVAGGALLAVDQVRPSWLRHIGLARTTVPPTTAAASHRAAAAGAAARHGASSSAAGAAGAVVTDALHPRPTSVSTASLDVGRAPVHLTISSVGGPCWVQVTSSTSSATLFAGVIPAGAHRTFTVTHGASVELGSAAGRVSVTSRSGRLTTYQAPAAPFTLSVRSSG